MESTVSVLDQLNEYRDCSRGLWNRAFMAKFQINQDWAISDSFARIKNELFRSIVLRQLDCSDDDYVLGKSSRLIKVKLRSRRKTAVMINREKRESAGYWDHPVKELDSNVSLQFIDLFDWNPYGFLDMNFVMCEIIDSPDCPDIEGHKLLVDLSYVDVLVECSF
ncbi:hypothetical protein G4G28_03335 [Massilia sp. Dwa41.01b]|uniref:hypothetical protein n=1 Tax=unclassified Massilia TaxID=2609279 RepID=UPI0016011BEA|nr:MULTISPECIES: hypothetical protein [unclassified Massilia]QNA87740.1 hypothetical protein G4G28_03335 [Massilia sp. Dwa41.01b]QNA98642.1 hypothetical protein G4G31_07065 [Massilia sp. Se16.2.3]